MSKSLNMVGFNLKLDVSNAQGYLSEYKVK